MSYVSSKTEAALDALVLAIDKIMAPKGFPQPTRNETLDQCEARLGDGNDGGLINVLDGNGEPVDEMMGSDDDSFSGFDIEHTAVVEMYVKTSDPKARDKTFDAFLQSLHDGIKADRTLGGAVDHTRFAGVERHNLEKESLPLIKAASINITLSFSSNRPF